MQHEWELLAPELLLRVVGDHQLEFTKGAVRVLDLGLVIISHVLLLSGQSLVVSSASADLRRNYLARP